MNAPARSPLLERGVRWSTIALAAMPVLGMRPLVWAIALWLILLVMRAFLQRPVLRRNDLLWCLLLGAPFLLMLIDLVRADDPRAGWHIAERSAALLLFPIGFLLLSAPADRRLREWAVDVFSGASLLLFLYVNGRLLLTPALLEQHPTALFSDRYRDAFAALSGIHPPYAAYYFVCAALFQFAAVLREPRSRPLRAAAALLLLIGAALIGSRMPLAAFAVAAVAVSLLALPRKQAARTALAVIAGAALIVALTPSARQRMRQALALETDRRMPTAATVNAVNIRLPISACSLELLREHWGTGMGQPRVQPALDHCYERFHIPLLLDGSYSTHCQPLHWWIAFGLVGLAAFVLLFAAPMRAAWRHGDGAAFGFLLIIVLCCLTENVLARQWGVVPFAYLNTLFLAGRRST